MEITIFFSVGAPVQLWGTATMEMATRCCFMFKTESHSAQDVGSMLGQCLQTLSQHRAGVMRFSHAFASKRDGGGARHGVTFAGRYKDLMWDQPASQ